MLTAKKKLAGLDWQTVRDRLGEAARAAEAARHTGSQRVQAVLEERARAIARVPDSAPAAGTILEIVIFTLGNERYALETNHVREVLRSRGITPLPGTPEFLAGIANLRGQILAVFDLRRFFGIPTNGETESSRLIVLGQERIEFGVLADSVHEVANLAISQVKEPPESVAGIARDYLRGVTPDALILLDGAALLHDPRLVIDLGEDTAPRYPEVKS
ncbi:MAG: purine-binding chemotaxis protein CheW [Planctomycetes bacterium]|nr:purine-binding chemotaxis protein CheW [Planctomycetota bacterium]